MVGEKKLRTVNATAAAILSVFASPEFTVRRRAAVASNSWGHCGAEKPLSVSARIGAAVGDSLHAGWLITHEIPRPCDPIVSLL